MSSLAHPGGNVTGMSVQMAEQGATAGVAQGQPACHASRSSRTRQSYCAIAVQEAQLGATALGLQIDSSKRRMRSLEHARDAGRVGAEAV